VCVPACAGKVCGPDGCPSTGSGSNDGGSCGTCADGQACSADGHCVAVAPEPVEPDRAEAVEATPESPEADVAEASPEPDLPSEVQSPDAGRDEGGGGCAYATSFDRSARALFLAGLAALALLAAHRRRGRRAS
jgi:MYXO-CTERM domain-containing protein